MMTRPFALAALAVLMAALPAQAQLGGLDLPPLPVPANLGAATGGLGDAEQGLDAPLAQTGAALRRVRSEAIAALLLRHRQALEADPAGNPIVRGEVLAIAPSDQALTAARALGFSVLQSDVIDAVGALVALQAPSGMTTAAALAALRHGDPSGTYDFDHLYLPSGAVVGGRAQSPAAAASQAGGTRIGLIDGGVGAHPCLRGAIAEQRAFASANVTPTAHATAVASLLAGRGDGVIGAAPEAQLYVADIYGGAATGGSSLSLARALSWLASLGVPVINISLVGPRNRIVEAVVESLVERGFVIVAAVGNDGPAAPPLYPAAYAGVVGVTGVDGQGRVLVEAERGPQVMFAAPGIANAAAGHDGVALVRGTSFAAPVVAGLVALRVQSIAASAAALEALRREARDLGAPGRDDVYGYGLLLAPPHRSIGAR